MSILNTSVSGMQADSNWLSSISQNVANSNTTGYKNVETDFSSLVDQIADGDADFGGVSTTPGLAAMRFRAMSSPLRRRPTSPSRAPASSSCPTRAARFPDAQRLLHAGRLRQPCQQRRLLPDGGERAERRFAARGEFADRPREGQCRQRRPDRDADHQRSLTANLPSTATPVAAANLPSANSASSTYTEATSLVVYDNLGGAHTINLYFTNTGTNTWEVDAYDASDGVGQRRLSVFVRPARDPDPDLRSDERRALLRLAAVDSRCRTGRR